MFEQLKHLDMETKLKNMMRLFLDAIRDYERENGSQICFDERPSQEFVEIFINSEDGFNYRELVSPECSNN